MSYKVHFFCSAILKERFLYTMFSGVLSPMWYADISRNYGPLRQYFSSQMYNFCIIRDVEKQTQIPTNIPSNCMSHIYASLSICLSLMMYLPRGIWPFFWLEIFRSLLFFPWPKHEQESIRLRMSLEFGAKLQKRNLSNQNIEIVIRKL